MIIKTFLLPLEHFSKHHTSRFFTTNTNYKPLLFHRTILNILFQIVFVEHFFLYHTHFNTEYKLASYFHQLSYTFVL